LYLYASCPLARLYLLVLAYRMHAGEQAIVVTRGTWTLDNIGTLGKLA